LVAFDDEHVGPVDEEGVGDAGTHPPAAQGPDACRKAGGGVQCAGIRVVGGMRHRHFFFLSFFFSRNACIRSNLASDSKSIDWASVSITGCASRGVWNTALDTRTASGSWAAIRSARAWAAASRSAGSTS